jgi:GNAT superfamily N-acetyltransferase
VSTEPTAAPATRPASRGGWWWCRIRGTDGTPTRLVEVESSRYPDGTHVDLNADSAAIQIGDDAICTALLDSDGTVLSLEVAHRFAPKAPPVWFGELRESNAHPPAVVLLAFTGGGQRPGRLFDETALTNVAVTVDDQLGALRWYPATGETDQLYVDPQWRRRNVASALLAAGELLSVARGWPRFWADGQRTALGEQARNARSWQLRTADLTHLHPPMTPGDTG